MKVGQVEIDSSIQVRATSMLRHITRYQIHSFSIQILSRNSCGKYAVG